MEWIRLIAGGAFLLAGLIIFAVEIYGVFHMKYVLNRMQAAALGDTLGISLSLIGLMIYSGFNMTTLKIALIVTFLWFSSPVASHLLAKLEATTNEDIDKYADRCDI
jgi:multicomponent Na+:H+ antiporter subunit G